MSRDRRIGIRVPFDNFLTQYISDRPYRSLCEDLSETGVRLTRVALPGLRLAPVDRVVGLEIDLPGTGETIWARGEICHEARRPSLSRAGIRFADMPRVHARMLREFCHSRRRARLLEMLERVRRPSSTAAAAPL
jgi:hypothetical protein